MSDIRPIHYKISLEPDLERFRFAGTAEITLETGSAVDEIVLNALDLNVTDVQGQAGGSACALFAVTGFKKRGTENSPARGHQRAIRTGHHLPGADQRQHGRILPQQLCS